MKTAFPPIGRSAVILSAFLLSLFPLCAGVPGDEHWDAQFGWPGPGGNNYAIATHNGRLYVSGLAATTNVALQVWDGAQWSPIGQFYGPATSSVGIYDLAFVGDTLYAAGIFTNVDGVAANGLAKWDGNAWSSIGFKGGAYSLAVDGGNLYVGGGFTTNLSGLAMKNVARWDGTSWAALGAGLGSTNVSIVYAVTATNGTVYAGGYFTNSGSLLVTNIARWNGTSWSALGGGLDSIVFSLALNGSDVYAGGQFGPSPYSGVAKWDGANWSLLGSGFNDRAQSIAVFNNLVCAAGSFTTAGVSASRFAVWNGASWAAAGAGLSSSGNRVISTGTKIYVGGNFLLAGGIMANGLAAWDGANWAQIGTAGRCNGLSFTVRAIAGGGTNLFVGGSFTAAGQTNANYIARFDGANWYSLGSGIGPVGGSTVVNAIAVTNNDVYVGGYFSTAGGVSALNVARWDGTTWHGFGSPGGMVYSLTVRPDGVYAAGTAYNGTQYGSEFFRRWNGANWQGVLNYNPDDTFVQILLSNSVGMDAVAFLGSDIYVGGRINMTWHDPDLINYTNCANILRFDGTYARIVGTGLNSNVVAMAVLETNLFVAGPFTNAGGVTANAIARWDGNVWSGVGGGVVGRGTINALSVVGTNLYAGGTFTNIGGTTATHVAKWDGNNWSPLGSGIPQVVSALDTDGSDVFAGGSVRIAGGKPSYYLGHWNDQSNFDTPQLVNPLWLASRQFRARLYGVSGLTNIIQATTNFTSWTPVLTNATGIYDFTDTNALNYPFRFYRAVLGP